LASNSIAERYPVHEMQPFDSDKVLADQGYPTLPSGRSERTFMAIRPERPTPKGHPSRRLDMKQLLIVLTLIVASAAPVAAEGFPNPYLTNL
jgi:hypothetical protein